MGTNVKASQQRSFGWGPSPPYQTQLAALPVPPPPAPLEKARRTQRQTHRAMRKGRAKVSLLSRGSKNHATGNCRPCLASATEEGCPRGVQCNFCHFDHNEEKVLEAEVFTAYKDTRRTMMQLAQANGSQIGGSQAGGSQVGGFEAGGSDLTAAWCPDMAWGPDTAQVFEPAYVEGWGVAQGFQPAYVHYDDSSVATSPHLYTNCNNWGSVAPPNSHFYF